MLEQRKAQEKGYITLKEAAELTGYTSDYVGQLIRAGKIQGEQVYCNTAWMTTQEEVRMYLVDKGKLTTAQAQLPFFEHKLFSYFLYTLIAICVISLALLQYIFYISLDSTFEQQYLSKTVPYVVESS